MTTDLENQLTAGMREQVTGLTLRDDILTDATRTHRRRIAAVRIGTTLGVVGLAGALAAGLTVNGPEKSPPPPAVQALPASLKLVDAATASGDISYRLRLTTSSHRYDGAFDPKTSTGYVRVANEAGILTELLIGGTRYIGTEPPAKGPTPSGTHEAYSRYGQYAGKFDKLSFALSGDPVLVTAAPDPASLLAALKGAKAKITENPDGTLHFQYGEKRADGSSTTTGDVTLDTAGRIAKVATKVTWQSTAKGRLDTGTYGTTLELTDYGVPVKVNPPIDVVPAN